jgi:hypothetical protein
MPLLETCLKMIGGGICMTLLREAIGLVSYIITSLFLIFSHIKFGAVVGSTKPTVLPFFL